MREEVKHSPHIIVNMILLQAGRPWVQFPMMSLNFAVDLILTSSLFIATVHEDLFLEPFLENRMLCRVLSALT
jgi:hypothetical protein